MTDQTALDTEPADLARLRRLRAQLAAEHAKAVRADQHPRPDLDHLHVSPHNGIAAGLEIALHFADHHLREAADGDGTEVDRLRAELATEQQLYERRTRQVERLCRERQEAEEQRDRLARVLADILGRFRISADAGDNQVRTDGVPCAQVEQWRAVLRDVPDSGPTIAELAADDRRWALERAGE